MNHEQLGCYQKLVDVAGRLSILVKGWPRGHGYLVDQLQRAIASAVLNLAEGNGKQGQSKDRRRFFNIALGSIAEVSACLDLGLAFSLLTPIECEELKGLLRQSYVAIRRLP